LFDGTAHGGCRVLQFGVVRLVLGTAFSPILGVVLGVHGAHQQIISFGIAHFVPTGLMVTNMVT
jgi:hypothetical protein